MYTDVSHGLAAPIIRADTTKFLNLLLELWVMGEMKMYARFSEQTWNRFLGGCRGKWEDSIIKMGLKEMECHVVDWIIWALYKVNMVGFWEDGIKYLGSLKRDELFDSRGTVDFSRRTLLHGVT
jgi:hypothetical protein